MANKAYPQQIFETGNDWGDSYYLDKDGIDETIESLRELGGEWEAVSIDDCSSYWIEEVIGARAIYKQEGIRADAFVIFEHGDNGDFNFVSGAHDTIEWAREMAE